MKYPPSEVSHSVGKNARRWGTMKARFQEVQLCNSKGKVCNTFNYKEGAIIQYSIVCVDPELKGYIQFNIIGPNGEWVSAIQSSSPQKKGTKFIEKKQGQVLLKELPYANGNYILEAALRDEEGNDIDVISHFIYFHMNTPLKDGTRVAALENTWN